jgi:hypoxanthine phosphoribosyltransferase
VGSGSGGTSADSTRLVVDDVADTGETLRLVMDQCAPAVMVVGRAADPERATSAVTATLAGTEGEYPA